MDRPYLPDGIEGEEVMADCKHCGADGSVCLWQEFHDGEAPCGATFDDDNGEDSAAPSKPSAAPEKQLRKINMIRSKNPAVAGVEGLAQETNSSMKSTEIPEGAGNKDASDGEGVSGERPAPVLTPKLFRELFARLHNVNRWDLEAAGMVKEGPAGQVQWKRFNTDLTRFVLKLPEEKLPALMKLAGLPASPEAKP